MNPIALATRGKGSLGMVKRATTIGQRYGITAARMDRTLWHFVEILGRFNCSATFPITTAALARSRGSIEHFQEQQIEFAVHGYYHVDHRQLSLVEQLSQFARARQIFAERGVTCHGFRYPYLRWNDETIAAVAQSGFLYDGSQGLAWDVTADVETAAYHRVLNFYGALPASQYPALPRLTNGLVRIPYSLPDDESLVDRFHLADPEPMTRLWLAILERTHQLGELFTLGLHPERTRLCEAPLVATLRNARALLPAVWIARLDQIANWWKARTLASVTIANALERGGDRQAGEILQLDVNGPPGTTVLARGVELLSDATPWAGGYQRLNGTSATLRSGRRPFIGVSRNSAPELTGFLRQQGLIVEQADNAASHSYYLDRPEFSQLDERPLLQAIEGGDVPLVRLGRWPDGAQSALAITGDIDALTIWDYGLRFLGH